MTENSPLPCDVLAVQRKKVTTDFAGGPTSSDGVLGLAGALAGSIRECRDGLGARGTAWEAAELEDLTPMRRRRAAVSMRAH